MKHTFNFLTINFSPQNSVSSFLTDSFFSCLSIVFTRVGPFPERAEHICRTLIFIPVERSRFGLVQWYARISIYDVNQVSHFDIAAWRLTSSWRCNTRFIILIDQLNINWQLTFHIRKWPLVNSRRKHTNIYGWLSALKEWQPEVFKRE